jgi:glycosyltransferase involved in cell wall biosynthesis
MTDIAKVSVAIPCHLSETSLLAALERIGRCRPLPAEVLVHADNGWQPVELYQRSWPFPVRVLESPVARGPGGGRDLLIRAANQDLVASFDDDSWPLDEDYFAKVVVLGAAFPDAAVIGAEVYLEEKPLAPPVGVVTETNGFDGSASVHRRSLYEKLPGYVPLPSAYGMEEVDLALQAHSAGMKVLGTPWLRAWHNRPLSDFSHATLPWVRNEWLQALLRYPWYVQPLGWLRVLRRVWNDRASSTVQALMTSALSAFQLAKELRSHRYIYSLREIYRHHRGPRRRWLIEFADAGCAELREVVGAPRVMFVQYTNPGAYPPLEHASQILARHGWQVLFVSATARDAELLLPPFPGIRVVNVGMSAPGWWQKVHYCWFLFACMGWALWYRPNWGYFSDRISTPSSWLLGRLCRYAVYHEHDSPTPGNDNTPFIRFLNRCRIHLARKAQLVLLPNEQRLAALMHQSGRTGPAHCVWNCSSTEEIGLPRLHLGAESEVRLLYHGSINPERFPMCLLEALSIAGEGVSIRLVGYETSGSIGYTSQLTEHAKRLGVADRFHFLGAMAREPLMQSCRECDVGLALLRIHEGDINMFHMVGASNKPFDYLSQGLAIVVHEDEAWREFYVQRGCAISCDGTSVQSLAETFRWLATHKTEVRAMGERGRQLSLKEWNYEYQFQPVLEAMETSDQF